MTSRVKLKPLYVRYCNLYGRQTYQVCNMLRGVSNDKFTWIFVKLCEKLNTLYIHLQKTHKQETRQGADLLWKATII